MKILITGSHGFIGHAFSLFLRKQEHEVFSLERGNSLKEKEGVITWDPERKRFDPSYFEGFDAMVHLAGKPLQIGWCSQKTKKKIIESRVLGTTQLTKIIHQLKTPPSVFISASAVGIYSSNTELLTEKSPLGSHFLGRLCQEWEEASLSLEVKGVRRVIARFGVVLSRNGGMLRKMMRGFSWMGGMVLGEGTQHVPWIHLEDTLKALYHLLVHQNSKGCYNLTAPHIETAEAFSHILAKALHRPLWGHLPQWVVKKMTGKIGKELLLSDLPVFPQKLIEEGFVFTYPLLSQAIEHEIGLEQT